MKFKSKKHPRPRAILCIMILIQIFVLLVFASYKSGYHIDEVFSYNLANSYNEPFYSIPDDFYLNWHESDYYKSLITVSGQHRFDYNTVYENQTGDVHPPLYYILLNTVCSFFPGSFSKWYGIALNIIIFSVTVYALWCLSKHFFKNPWTALIPCAVYGFSAGAICTVTFVRMYMLFALNVTLLFYINILLLEKTNRRRLAALFLIILAGFMTQYYFLIIAFFITLLGCIWRLIKRRYTSFFTYSIVALIGVMAGIIIYPACIDQIFSGYRGEEAFSNFALDNDYFQRVLTYYKVISDRQFGGLLTILICVCVAAVLAALIIRAVRFTKHKDAKGQDINTVSRKAQTASYKINPDIAILCMALSITAYFLMVTKIAPYLEDRYVFCFYPALSLVASYVVWRCAGLFIKSKFRVSIIAAAVLLGLNVFAVCAGQADFYLYRDEPDKLAISEQYSSYPCVYLNGRINQWYIYDNMEEILEFKQVYFMDNPREAARAISSNSDCENGMVAFIDNQTFLTADALREIKGRSNANFLYSELLFTTTYANVYYFHN